MSQSTKDFWAHQTAVEYVRKDVQSPGPHNSPLPKSPLPDLVRESPAGRAAHLDEGKRGAPRRSTAAMQLEMVNKGAFFLHFQQPVLAPDGTPLPAVNNGESATAEERAYSKSVQDFRCMEEKGFLVTKDIGCLLPHDQYGSKGAGDTLKGHQRAAYFFCALIPKRDTVEMKKKIGKPPKGAAPRDANGWPVASQISHLCHRASCTRIDHEQIETQAQNLRRNYCGIMGLGECDCGMQPPCLRMYHPRDWEDPNLELCETEADVKAVLLPLQRRHPFELIPRDQVQRAAREQESATTGVKGKRSAVKALFADAGKQASRKRAKSQ